MRRGYLPVKDVDLRLWAERLAAQLASDPERVGVRVAAAEAFAEAQAAFSEAMEHVTPQHRTRGTVAAKDAARVRLELVARRINAMIHGSGLANEKTLLDLGLTVYKTSYRRIGRPTARPTVRVRSVGAPMIDLEVFESGTSRVGLPPDVAGAVVCHWIGDSPPGLDHWPVAAHVSRARLSVPVEAAPGTKVWFAAYYLNRRGERGPWGAIRHTHALGGMLMPSLAA